MDLLIHAVKEDRYSVEDVQIDLRQKLDQYQKCSAAFTRYLESVRSTESENQQKINRSKLISLETTVGSLLKQIDQHSVQENTNENEHSSKQNSQSELENTIVKQEINIDNPPETESGA